MSSVKVLELIGRLEILRQERPDGARPVDAELETVGRCRSCSRPVLWGKFKGKPHPFDLDGATHFSTCPEAEDWRERRRRARAEANGEAAERPDGPQAGPEEIGRPGAFQGPAFVGSVYRMKRDWPALDVKAGDVGITVEVYRGGANLLFGNGESCGYSDDELAQYCVRVGDLGPIYRFANVIALRFDFDRGVFRQAFLDAERLGKSGGAGA